MNRVFRNTGAPFCALVLLSTAAVAAEPEVRFVQLKPAGSDKHHAHRRLKMHNLVEPAGGSGFALNAPASIGTAAGIPIGIYANPNDANFLDSVSKRGGPQIVSVDLQLIFWGSAWPNNVNPSANDVTNAVRYLLQSHYLSQMRQYGFQSVNFRGVTFVTGPNPPANYTSDDVANLVWNLIDDNKFPEPDEPGGRILYMVIMPPGTTPPPNSLGAHGDASDYDFPADVDWLWYGWASYGNLDRIMKSFSHELVESISNPEPDSPAWTMSRTLNGGNEIGDACNNTVDVVGGFDVQAYWSQAYQACVLPLDSGRPVVQSLSEHSGPVTGGTEVVIRGRLFLNVSEVNFGGTPAGFRIDSPFQITATSPKSRSAGVVDVHVVSPLGPSDSLSADEFRYSVIIRSVTPSSGTMDGGTTVTITGAGFGDTQPFDFGGKAAINVYCYSSEECVMATPASSPGTVAVVPAGGVSGPPGYFTFLGPAITGITPKVGPEQGGTGVYIHGVSLGQDMIVHFGGHDLTVSCTSDTSCVTVSPPGKGSVHLTATRDGRTTLPTPADVFTYLPFPYGTISPDHGPDTGGTVVTITGGNFSTAPGATHFIFSYLGGGPDQLPTNVICSSTSVCKLTTPPCGDNNSCWFEPIAIIKATVGGLTRDIALFTYQLTNPPPTPPPPIGPPCNPRNPHTCQ